MTLKKNRVGKVRACARSICRVAPSLGFWLLSGLVATTEAQTPTDIFEGSTSTFDPIKIERDDAKVGDWGVAEQLGAITYSYPIRIPPARNGLQPALTLRYSSRSPLRGGLAVGWTLDIPSIRVDRSLGGEPVPRFRISLGAVSDRLVRVNDDSPFNPGQGETYRPEFDDNFTRVFRVSAGGTHPGLRGWVALTPDGVTHFFEESLLPTTFDGTRWQITRQVDPFGNTVRYTWLPVLENGTSGAVIDIVLRRVEYSGNAPAGLAPHARVDLEYFDTLERCFGSKIPIGAVHRANLGNGTRGYMDGTRRLTSISVFVKDNATANRRLARTIALRYNLDAAGSLEARCNAMLQGVGLDTRFRYLTEIQETGFDANGVAASLPPVLFRYGRRERESDMRQTRTVQRGLDYRGGKQGALSTLLDVNGDGITDRLVVDQQAAVCQLAWHRGQFGGAIEATRSPLRQFPELKACSLNGGSTFGEVGPNQFKTEQVSLHLIDFGTGFDTLLSNRWFEIESCPHPDPSEPNDGCHITRPFLPEGMEDGRLVWRAHKLSGSTSSIVKSPEIVGLKSRKFPPVLTPSSSEENVALTVHPQTSIPLFGDLDGNGWIDFIDVGTHPTLLGLGKWRVGFGSPKFGELVEWPVPIIALAKQNRGFFEEESPNKKHHKLVVIAGLHDVNGDGAPDLLFQGANLKLQALLNVGKGFSEQPIDLGISAPVEEIQTNFEGPATSFKDGARGYRRRMLDVDGDGLVDMLVFSGPNNDINTTTKTEVHLNLGDRFTPPVTLSDAANAWRRAKRLMRSKEGNWFLKTDLLDANGDGLLDLVRWAEDTGAVDITTDTESAFAPRSLIEVKNGRGGLMQFLYKPATDPTVVTADGTSKLPRPVWVVATVRTEAGSGTPRTLVHYRYGAPAYLPPNGRTTSDESPQFLGFREVTMTQTGTPLNTAVKRVRRAYAYDASGDPSGRVVQEWTFHGKGEELRLHQYVENTWKQEPLFSGQSVFTRLVNSITRTCLPASTEADCMVQQAHALRRAETWIPQSPSQGPPVFDPDNGTPPAKLYVRTLSQEGGGVTEGDHDRRTFFDYQIRYGQTEDPVGGPLFRLDDYRILVREVRDEGARRVGNRRVFELSGLRRLEFDRETGLPVVTHEHSTADRVSSTVRTFDPRTGNVLTETKPEQAKPNGSGKKTKYAFDSHELFLRSITNELGHVVNTVHDVASGRLVRRIGPNAKRVNGLRVPEVEAWTLDGLGRVTEHARSFDDPVAGYVVKAIQRTVYTDQSIPSQVCTQRRSNVDVPFKEALCREAVPGTDRTLSTTVRTFDGFGRLLSETNRLVGIPDALTRYRYDVHGNVRSIQAPSPLVDAGIATTTLEYDGLNRPVLELRPDGSGATFTYLALETTRTELTTDGSGASRKEVRDVFGRLIEVHEHASDEAAAITIYEYDANDNLRHFTDADGTTTNVRYDFAGRLLDVERGGRRWRYRYNRNGNLRTKREPVPDGEPLDAFTSVYDYDALDRITSYTPATRGRSTERLAELGIGRIFYEHDRGENGIGRISAVRLPFGRIEQSYDAQGLVTREERAFSVSHRAHVSGTQVVRRTYDALGNLTTSVWDDGQTWQATYDERGLVRTVAHVDPSTQVSRMAAAFERGTAGLVTRRSSASDQQRTYTYDRLGRPITDAIVRLTPGGSMPVAHRSYTYSGSGDLLTVAGETLGVDAAATYGYDAQHRLRTAAGPNGYAAAFSYSPAGNLQTADVAWAGAPETRSVRYEYGARDPQAVDRVIHQATAAAFATVEYDLPGNATVRTTAAGRSTFEWDADGQMREAAGPNGAELYYYDQAGARMLAIGEKTGVRFWFAESETHFDVEGRQLRRYLHLSNNGEVLARIENGTAMELQYADALRNLMVSLTESGEPTASFLYGAFGEVVHAIGETDHRRQFNDKEHDATTGLRYYGFRYYDPLLLRWTSADPLYHLAPDLAWTEPQRANLYAFSLNNPLRYYDPDGHDPKEHESPLPTTEAILDGLLWVPKQKVDSAAAKTGQIAYTIVIMPVVAVGALAGYAIDEVSHGWYGIPFGVPLIKEALEDPEPKGLSVDVDGDRERASETRLSRVKLAGMEDRKRADVRDDDHKKKRVEDTPKRKHSDNKATDTNRIRTEPRKKAEEPRWDIYGRTLWPEWR